MTEVLIPPPIFFQFTLAGVVGRFPQSYVSALTEGQALGGIFEAVLNVVSFIKYLNPV